MCRLCRKHQTRFRVHSLQLLPDYHPSGQATKTDYLLLHVEHKDMGPLDKKRQLIRRLIVYNYNCIITECSDTFVGAAQQTRDVDPVLV